jgi:hypothetical protein
MMKKHSTRRHPWAAQVDAEYAQEQLAKLVQDRKTGEFYDPKEVFDQLMNKPEILEVFKRLKIR